MQNALYTRAIKLIVSLSAVYSVVTALFNFNSYGTIGTALIHVPLALFSAYSAFITLPINARYSALAALFALLNAAMV